MLTNILLYGAVIALGVFYVVRRSANKKARSR